MRLPDGDGLDLVAWIQGEPLKTSRWRSSPPMAMSNRPCARSSSAHSISYPRPLDLGVLRKLVGSAIKLGNRADDRTGITFRGPRLLATPTFMEQLREMISRVARSQAPVHIYGEVRHGQGTRRAHGSRERRPP